MTDEEIRKAITEKLTVPLWPQAGQALNLGRSATYTAAASGKIPTVGVGRKKLVPCPWLRKYLQIEGT
jgi:hypothetical protein